MTITADEFERSDRGGIVRWTGSLLIILALHAGLLLIITLRQLTTEPIGMPPAAVMIDLAPLPAPPLIEPSVVPPPPEPQVQTPPLEPQAEPLPLPEPELPKLAPSPAPHPAVTLPAPQPPKPKPKVKRAEPLPMPCNPNRRRLPPWRRRRQQQRPKSRRTRHLPLAQAGRRSSSRGWRSTSITRAWRKSSVNREWFISASRSIARAKCWPPKSTRVRASSCWMTRCWRWSNERSRCRLLPRR